jgi:hypothetical protein
MPSALRSSCFSSPYALQQRRQRPRLHGPQRATIFRIERDDVFDASGPL